MNESEAERRLRFLCSCDAEALDDYRRINHFITASYAVLAEMQSLRDAFMEARQEVADRFHLTEVKGLMEKAGRDKQSELLEQIDFLTEQLRWERAQHVEALKGKVQ